MGHFVLTISLDLMKSSEVRIAGDQPNYENMRKGIPKSFTIFSNRNKIA